MALIKVSVTNLNGSTDMIGVQEGTSIAELFEEILEISKNTPFTVNGEGNVDNEYELESGDSVVLQPKKNTNG